jgi:hypothetical protein
MRSTSRLRKTANLSESILQQLNMYALAASAAGVGLLAAAPPAEAKIVYTPAHKLITPNHTIPLDLNHDGIADFRLKDIRFTTSPYGFSHIAMLSVVPARNANKAAGYSAFNRHYASALKAGVSIGPKRKFASGAMQMAYVMSDTGAHRGTAAECLGPWGDVVNRYLGLKFLVQGKVHFGWARLSVRCSGFVNVDATLTGYAYETIPNKPIIAGATKGPDDISVEGPEAALSIPTPDRLTLGALALGAPGLSIRRRKESADALS